MGGQFWWTFCDTQTHTDGLTEWPSYIAALGAAKNILKKNIFFRKISKVEIFGGHLWHTDRHTNGQT